MQGGKGRGFASLLVMLFLVAGGVLGAGVLYFARNSVSMVTLAEQEERLRLFAEGEIEAEAERLLARAGDISQEVGAEEALGDYQMDGMRCRIYRKQRTEGIELIAVAEGTDLQGRTAYRKLHAFLEKRKRGGEVRYVWKSYLTEGS